MKKHLLNYSTLFLTIIVSTTACESVPTDNKPSYSNELLSSDDINTNSVELNRVTPPDSLYYDFVQMVENVKSMNSAEIDSLESFEILQLGLPIQLATAETIFFEKNLLNEALVYLKRLINSYHSFSKTDLNFLNLQVESILEKNKSIKNKYNQKYNDDQLIRNVHYFMDLGELREILKNWVSDSPNNNSCEDLFNKINNYILISPGENLSVANFTCPDSSKFVLRAGTYVNQFVANSKSGNTWIGLGEVVLDGKNTTLRAFDGGLDMNTIALIKFRNYYYHGIYSLSGPTDLNISRVNFQNIAPDSSGQDYGAIKLDNASDITVSKSHFENVASAVRFRFSSGPLKVINNTALNPGRNFFQCDDCNGSGIQINQNSMERTDSYGVAVLEDWINIFKSNGDINDWIQVNYNRARGHSLSGSGSFIMLGDAGGSYQEAVGNIGVNPGQVGIGIAGGENIKVEANVMYSVPWDSSNVAYYSAQNSLSCRNHQFPNIDDGAEPNRANWICGDEFNCQDPPRMNYAWTDGRCGIDLNRIRRNVRVDRSMGPDIWDEWLNE
jgi:ABC-type transporter Mla MlaB component